MGLAPSIYKMVFAKRDVHDQAISFGSRAVALSVGKLTQLSVRKRSRMGISHIEVRAV